MITPEQIEELAEQIYSGAIDINNLPEWLHNTNLEELLTAIKEGWYNDPNITWQITAPEWELLSYFRQNIMLFSGAKTFQQVMLLQDLMYDENGYFRDFSEFKEEAMAILETQNVNWLKTEVATVQRQTQSARNFFDAWNNKDTLPYLEYKAVMDSRTRPEHASLHGIILEVVDPFWDTYMPLNGWYCRCGVSSLDASAKPTAKDNSFYDRIEEARENTPEIFRNNPAKQGFIFAPDHPYFNIPDSEKWRFADNFGFGFNEN